MPSRKYVSDKAGLLSEARWILSSDDEAKFIHRVECVNFVLAGMTVSEVAKYVPESRSTINGWIRTAAELGFDALRPGKKPKEIQELTDEQS